MAKIKFIHTADIHLGSLLNYGGETSNQRLSVFFREAGYRALQLIFDKALTYEVDFIIIAGDLYDREARSVKASRFFVDQCKRLQKKEIAVYIIAGNHDPFMEKKEPFTLPDNVFLFPSQEVSRREIRDNQGRLRAHIHGQSYRQKFESRSMYKFFTAADESIFNIGILHTQLDTDNNHYVPVSLPDLIKKDDIQYWALGHLHKPQILNRSRPIVIFPGTPQGKNISEQEAAGCFMVEFDSDNRETEISFIPTAGIIFKKIELKIDDIEGKSLHNISDLEKALMAKARQLLTENPCDSLEISGLENMEIEDKEKYFQNYFRGYVVRWIITGRGQIHQMIAENREEVAFELQEKLNDFFSEENPFLWTHSFLFQTGKELAEIESLLSDNQVFKELNQLVKEILNKEDYRDELLNSLGIIWQGSSDHEEKQATKFFADQQSLQEVLKEAKQRIIEELFVRDGGES